MLKNLLLSLIVLNTSQTKLSSRCFIMNALYPNSSLSPTQIDSLVFQSNKQQQQQQSVNKKIDDIHFRFSLFSLITKNGALGKNLDPDLTSTIDILFLFNFCNMIHVTFIYIYISIPGIIII